MTGTGARRARDREITEARLVEAVGTVLARDGFAALGVNAVAREAGVDKVLVYRYFGGMPALLRAFGEQGRFWPTDEELLGGDADALAALDPARRWAALAVNAVRGIRARPLTHEILAWELVEQNELTRILEEVREAQFVRLLARFGDGVDPAGPVPMAVALGVAAGNYLLCRARTIVTFAGLDLRADATWARIEEMVERLVLAAADGGLPERASRERPRPRPTRPDAAT